VVAALTVFALLYWHGRPRVLLARDTSGWFRAFAAGVAVGAAIFLWIYLPAYLEHHAFWEEDLMGALTAHDASRWPTWDFVWALGTYESVRVFRFAFVAGALASLPWLTGDHKVRWYAIAFLLVSLFVLVAPVRFEYFSLWRVFMTPLPGFSAIRDPRRIIYVYELAVVFLAAALIGRLADRAPLRIFMGLAVVGLLFADWNKEVFAFNRQADQYRHWVAAPVDVDRRCRSFFITPASPVYTSRWGNPGIVYNLDAMFVALNYSLPTLNGYSAWFPDGWRLFDPSHSGYPQAVASWVQQRGLTDVCAFDIEERKMRPYRP